MKFKSIVIALLLISLTACSSSFYYDNDKLHAILVSSEMIENVEFNNYTLTYNTINYVDDLGELINDLCVIKFIHTLGRPQQLKGECKKLNYSDGFEVICKDAIVIFDIDGNALTHKDIYQPSGFDELIIKFRHL